MSDDRVGAATRRQYRFGEYTLDLDDGFLRHRNTDVQLRPKTFEVLAYLVAHHGRLVTKEELVRAVWPNVIVTDNSLSQCIVEIRRALGDEQQQTIRTVARRGYTFAASVDLHRDTEPPTVLHARSGSARAPSRQWLAAGIVAAFAIPAIAWIALNQLPDRPRLDYVQLTDFSDSAVAPVLSPDGRMVAFIRGQQAFFSPDQVWVKTLPNGEALQLTDSRALKFQPYFSPDSSQVAYGVVEAGGWHTYAVSVTGGPSRMLRAESTGLTWLDDERLLFSTQRGGHMHMGVVVAPVEGERVRDVYWPDHQRAMAHFSYPSPDRQWALIVEMDQQPVWLACRLVPLDGSSAGRQVGPRGQCTSAGWSPDGKWMYFSVDVNGDRQLWRQRFSGAEPEQLTFGPTEALGLTVDPDGHSLITSIGYTRSELLLHDARREREIVTEGTVSSVGLSQASMANRGWSSVPSFSADGRYLFYLLHRQSPGGAFELWRTDLETDRREAIVPGYSIFEYDISPDAREVVFSKGPDTSHTEIWVAFVDGRAPPRKLVEGAVGSPQLGPGDHVSFRRTEGSVNYLHRIGPDGAEERIAHHAINTVQGSSPDGREIAALLADGASFVLPVDGGEPKRICAGACEIRWAPDSSWLYVSLRRPSRQDRGTTLAIPLGPLGELPEFPPGGLADAEHAKQWFANAVAIDNGEVVPGVDLDTYAYVRTTSHRNLYRVTLD